MIPAYFYEEEEYGYLRHVSPYYSTVHVYDENCNSDLSESESFVTHSALYIHTRSYTRTKTQVSWHQNTDNNLRSNNGLKKHDLVRNSAFNPSDNDIICCNDSFYLGFAAKVLANESDSLIYFNSVGVDIYLCNRLFKSLTSSPDYKHDYQKFRVNLKKDNSVGVIQLFQSSKTGASINGRKVPFGTIRNIFVARQGSEHLAVPPMITILPKMHQTYVPLQAGQRLQIVIPHSHSLQLADNKDGAIRKVCSFTNRELGYDCHEFLCCEELMEDSFPIFINSKNSNSVYVVIIPPIELYGSHRYAVIHWPLNNLSIIPNNIHGMVFRVLGKAFGPRYGYLDRSSRLKIESNYTDTGKLEIQDIRVAIYDKIAKELKVENLFDDGCKTSSI